MQEMWVQSLGGEDTLQEEMVTQSSIHACKIPRREEPGGLQSLELQRGWHIWSDLACMHSELHSLHREIIWKLLKTIGYSKHLLDVNGKKLYLLGKDYTSY